MRGIKLILVLVLLVPTVSAATLQGNIYDFSLNRVEAIVEINTTPSQKIVAQRSYEFQVEPGTYKIRARQLEGNQVVASTEENITVRSNGTFTRDLILFPRVDVNESFGVDGAPVESEEFSFWDPINDALPYLAALSILIFLWGLHYSHKHHMREQKKEDWEEHDLELDEDAQKILEYIDEEKRTTQKQIRNEFSYSQSKISLILTELEEKGLIKKIKRGRGNVIIRN